jgi:hypothetical protein
MNERVVHFCCICKKQFNPNPRLGDRQRTCGRDNCQKERRRINSRNWRARNPEGDDATYRRIRRRDRREYRRQYWAAHPIAREHHAAYMRQWRARRAAARVRDPYRDTKVKFPEINTYLQVTDVRDANRVFEVKVLSHNELSRVLHA